MQAMWQQRWSRIAVVAVLFTTASGILLATVMHPAEALRHHAIVSSQHEATSTLPSINTAELGGETYTEGIASDNTNTEVVTPPRDHWQTVLIQPGDTISSILAPYMSMPSGIHALLNQSPDAKRLVRIRAGESIEIQTDNENRLLALRYAIDNTHALHVQRIDDEYTVRIEAMPLERRIENSSGVIETSLFASAQAAGLSDATTLELARIFGWDIDFALDLRPGDRYSVVYEKTYHEGQAIGQPKILAAEFINDGTVYRAVYYHNRNVGGDYYTPDGKLMRKTFFRTPVDFSRISSTFSTGRRHPVLNRIRAHRGVDYAAATGTPIKATANGVVAAMSNRGGYGRTIVLQHGKRYTTLYAHLSRFAQGMRAGSKVRQGDVIGYVGQTGLATGPHLHYEFRVDGIHRNPLTVKVAAASEAISSADRNAFQQIAQAAVAQLDHLRTQTLALDNTRPRPSPTTP